MLHNYIISLKHAKERLMHIENEFNNKNISFQFFDALSPSTELDIVISNLLPNLSLTRRTRGEQACFASHLLLWKKCIHENLPYIGIFEDDVLLSQDAELFLGTDSWLKERFSNTAWVIRLETFLMKIKSQQSHISSYSNHHFIQPNTIHYGTAGYIISQSAADQLLNYILPSFLPDELNAIDMLLFGKILTDSRVKIYQLTPAICIQEARYYMKDSILPSQLETERLQLQTQLAIESPPKRKNLYEKITHVLTKVSREKEKRRYHIIPFDFQ